MDLAFFINPLAQPPPQPLLASVRNTPAKHVLFVVGTKKYPAETLGASVDMKNTETFTEQKYPH